MEQAGQELLRALRGKRSQRAFARRLGYRANPIANWEAGRRFPTAAETLRACARVGIDVPAAFRRFHPQTADTIGAADEAGIARWLDALRGSTPVSDVAARAGRSRFAVSRWLAGRTRPRLPDFLRLVEAMSGRASDLVAELVPIDRVPTLRDQHRAKLRARELAFAQPWTEAVLRVLETDAYRRLGAHEPGLIARVLGIDLRTEEHCLANMERAGIVTREGGVYRDAGPLTVDMRPAPAVVSESKLHWYRVALGRAAAPGPEDAFGYNVFSLSNESYARVRELVRETYREVRSIVAAPQAIERVALLNLQLMEWRPD